MKQHVLMTVLAGALGFAHLVQAEEGGSGHYLPGAAATFVDAFPGKPGGLAAVSYYTYYDGSAGGNRQLPLGGFLTADVDATINAETLGLIYQTPWNVLGGGLAMGVAVPYVWVDVEAQAQRIRPDGTTGPVVSRSDRENGIGDMQIYPFMLGWTNLVTDLKLDVRLGIYAPTGDYEAGTLANTGKNYWTFEPGIMASWLSSKYGTEVTLYTAMDFNTKNDDTDYESGTSFHADLTVAQHLPFLGGFIGVGANGFYYDQIEGDSGSGAVLGDFESLTWGVGPVISYVRQVGKTQVIAEVKWLPELDVDKRLEGDYIWFKVVCLF